MARKPTCKTLQNREAKLQKKYLSAQDRLEKKRNNVFSGYRTNDVNDLPKKVQTSLKRMNTNTVKLGKAWQKALNAQADC